LKVETEFAFLWLNFLPHFYQAKLINIPNEQELTFVLY
jgi:hypothetical protein